MFMAVMMKYLSMAQISITALKKPLFTMIFNIVSSMLYFFNLINNSGRRQSSSNICSYYFTSKSLSIQIAAFIWKNLELEG